eukprot:6178071-Pleurochrysis_carterae.AAC.3
MAHSSSLIRFDEAVWHAIQTLHATSPDGSAPLRLPSMCVKPAELAAGSCGSMASRSKLSFRAGILRHTDMNYLPAKIASDRAKSDPSFDTSPRLVVHDPTHLVGLGKRYGIHANKAYVDNNFKRAAAVYDPQLTHRRSSGRGAAGRQKTTSRTFSSLSYVTTPSSNANGQCHELYVIKH